MKKNLTLLLSFIFFCAAAVAQERTISGIVTDKSNTPLQGVTVSANAGKSITQTDDNGRYRLTVPGNVKVITFTYVDYESATASIGSSNVINSSLKSKESALQEVVVVAYGTVKKENFTGSASTISGADIAERPITNVATAIVGASPGVQTNAGSGQPGAAPDVRIRGIGSVSASNDPLYVVDGVPFSGSIANLNAADIETLTILKDAASTSLYGARAANGVVMITTKKGKKGAKPTISLSLNAGSTDRAIPEYSRVNVYEYYPVYWQAYRNSLIYRTSNPFTPAAASIEASKTIKSLLAYNPFNVADSAIVGVDGKLNPTAKLLYNPDDLDWEKSITRKGQRQDVGLTISGGQDKTDYFMSLAYLQEKGYLIRSDYRRVNGRLNVNTQATPWFKAGLNVSGTFTKSNQASSIGTSAFVNPFNFTRGIGAIYPVYAYNPASPGNYLLDGSGNRRYDYGNMSALGLPNRPGGGYGGRHITAETELNESFFKRNFWGARTYGEFTFLQDFKFTTNISVDVTNRNDLVYRNKEIGDAAPNGSVDKSNQIITSYNFNQLLSYGKKIRDHNFDVLVGHENYDYSQEDFDAGRTNQIISGNYELVNFSQPGSSNSVANAVKREGYFTRVNYDYQSKYFISASYRRDASSKFDKPVRWGDFYSAGVAWRIDQENFLKDSRVISMLKFKASYGETGNDGGIDNYAFQPLFTVGFNNALEPGVIQGSLGNQDLEWEASRQTDIGIEFGLFKNRITGTLEYYKRVSDNLLFDVPLPLSSGTTSQTQNIGSMFNRGLEFNINADILRIKNFTWNVNLNVSTFENEITKLPQEEIINGSKKLMVGHSIYDYWLREWQGVDPADGYALYRADDPALAGTRIRKGGDTVTINQNNGRYHYAGSAIPDYFGSFTSSFRYLGFELSVLTTFRKGGYIYDSQYAGLMDPGNYGSSSHKDVLMAWQKPGDITEIPRMDAGQRGISNAASDRWLTDASFLNIRNLSLSYTVDAGAIAKLKMRSIRFSVNAENLRIFTERSGMNVEENFNGTVSQSYLPTKVFSAGINITF